MALPWSKCISSRLPYRWRDFRSDAEAQVGLKQFPAGITPPLVISYNASSVPILQLGLSGKGLSEQQLNDLGLNFIRRSCIDQGSRFLLGE